MDALERRCWFGGGGSIIISQRHRWDAMDLVKWQHGDILRRCSTMTCALILAAGLFTDSSLVGDGASWDLAMMLGISSYVHLGGIGVSRRSLALVSARDYKDGSIFFISFRVLFAKF